MEETCTQNKPNSTDLLVSKLGAKTLECDEQLNDNEDEPVSDNNEPKPIQVTGLEFGWEIFGFLLYVCDIFADYFVAFRYIYTGDYLYCLYTLCVVYFTVIYDVFMFSDFLPRKCNKSMVQYVCLRLLNAHGAIEYWSLLRLRYKILCNKVSNEPNIKETLLDKQNRVAWLKYVESLLEACPQLILQLYLTLDSLALADSSTYVTRWFQIFCVITSLLTSGTAHMNWEKVIRLDSYGEHGVSLFGCFALLCWLTPVTACRLVSLTLVLLVSLPLGVFCAILHILIASTISHIAEVGFRSFLCKRTVDYYCHALMVGVLWSVAPYASPYRETAVWRLSWLHVVHMVGNIAATTAWALSSINVYCTNPVLYYIIIATNCTLCVIGTTLGYIFYKFHHHFYKNACSF